MATSGRIALWYDCSTHWGDHERPADQEVRRRDPHAEQQGAGRHGEGRHAGRRARVRNREADDHSRRNRRMTDRSDAPSATDSPALEPYSPRRRTALVLTGTGTAGAYHAGALRALHE